MVPGNLRSLITFDPAMHVYRWRGHSYPSVTQVIDAGGYIDYGHVPPDILKRAAAIGNEVHSAIFMHHLLGMSFDRFAGTPARAYLAGYERFLSETGFQAIENEVVAIEPDLKYAGTLDVVGFLYGARVIIDYKTTSVINKPAVELQTSAYERLWTHGKMNPRYDSLERGDIHARYVLQLRKNARYSLVKCDDPTSFGRFCGLLAA